MDERKQGEVRVADQVIAVIAGVAAQEVSGIWIRSGGLYQDIARRVSGSHVPKGITVHLSDEVVRLDMRVSVSYGVQIQEACHRLQERVKKEVELFTGLYVEEVNIRVEGLDTK